MQGSKPELHTCQESAGLLSTACICLLFRTHQQPYLSLFFMIPGGRQSLIREQPGRQVPCSQLCFHCLAQDWGVVRSEVFARSLQKHLKVCSKVDRYLALEGPHEREVLKGPE